MTNNISEIVSNLEHAAYRVVLGKNKPGHDDNIALFRERYAEFIAYEPQTDDQHESVMDAELWLEDLGMLWDTDFIAIINQ